MQELIMINYEYHIGDQEWH